MFDALRYGAIGLGAILAVLAYRLLRREQEQPEPRKPVLVATFVYMAFSLILFGAGFALELLRVGTFVHEPALNASADRSGRRGQSDVRNRSSEISAASPEDDLSAVDVTGDWDFQVVASAGVDNSGRRFEINQPPSSFRISIRQQSERVTGRYTWASDNSCARGSISGTRRGNHVE